MDPLFTLAELETVIPIVRASVPPTPPYVWPQLKARTGVDVVVKHENHTPIGSFKVRGGLVYFDRLKRRRPQVRGIVTATRGNHGQSLAFAGSRAGIAVTIVVPHGNSTEKNAAMRSLGAELIEHGRDFDDANQSAICCIAAPRICRHLAADSRLAEPVTADPARPHDHHQHVAVVNARLNLFAKIQPWWDVIDVAKDILASIPAGEPIEDAASDVHGIITAIGNHDLGHMDSTRAGCTIDPIIVCSA